MPPHSTPRDPKTSVSSSPDGGKSPRAASKTQAQTNTAGEDKSLPFPFPTAENHDNPPVIEQPVLQDTSEDALDAGVEESFPASDPVSVTVTKVIPTVQKKGQPNDE